LSQINNLLNLVLADLFFSETVTKELASLNLVREAIYKAIEQCSGTGSQSLYGSRSRSGSFYRQAKIIENP
jgi:hypothetical protein